ncbi:hypothetical protein H2198_003924 [Neophaeococcomyces mojaviensis]|uniref:Uncharacterized protein n=1 Tax=Neophaeococcomyces mojaviensis TaxID=3383035 RepID=A0ACC3AA01_9EURO|nr:hypothetical protein H2198_003924 [Knufia sp. JES_112]
MLSPAISVPHNQAPAESANLQTPTTRRRGLSYLRSLSSHTHSSNNSPDSSRTSPRHFFVRSTSYQEAKNNRAPEGRRRSQSQARPHEPTASTSSVALARTATSTGAEPSTQAETAQSPPTPTPPPVDANNDDMARNTPSSASRRVTSENMPEGATMSRSASGNGVNGTSGEADPKQPLPTIRFYPHQDHNRLGRQSLNFTPISRTLPNDGAIIRVGRYSEREGPPTANPTTPSDAPVGFKSKVVSRKHCEFCFVDGQWQIRDVASSSGTFLNHIRLSQPNQESRLYPIKDGDIVQLGIDFRGGEEMIFRCVKIRIECNRSWQKKPNTFNKTRQAQLRGLASDQPAAGKNDGECTICLGNVLPCQALFIAPCAHIWHYKCIRPVLEGRSYPQFQCPNCRAYSDLEADVDVDMDDWNEEEEDAPDANLDVDQADRPGRNPEITTSAEPAQTAESTTHGDATAVQPAAETTNTNLSNSSLLARRQDRSTAPPPDNLSPPVSNILMPTRPSEAEIHDHLAQQRTQTESPNAEQIIAGEGPLTPRNNAGPFVFDGSGSRAASRRSLNVPDMRSLDEISDGIE